MKKFTILPAFILLGWLVACAPRSGTSTGSSTNSGNTSVKESPGNISNNTQPSTANSESAPNNVTDGKFGNQPPEAVTEGFKKKYPSYTSGGWTVDKGQYSTTYLNDGKSYRTNFSNTGEWLDTQNDIVLDDLPASVKQAFQNSSYGAASNPRFSQIETPQYPMLYKVEGQMNNQSFNIYFTPEGRMIELPPH